MTTLALLESRSQDILSDVNARLAVRDVLLTQLKQLNETTTILQQALADTEEASIVIAAVEKAQQDQLKTKLEKLVSYALTVIFERPYKFLVEFTTRGQQSDATFKIQDELGNAQIVKDAHGGGLLVVVAYILRAIVMMSAQPRLLPIMVDDEPFAQVAAEHRDRLIEFLQKFAESSGVQIVIVTHNQDLANIGDKKYRFKLVNGSTKVEELT